MQTTHTHSSSKGAEGEEPFMGGEEREEKERKRGAFGCLFTSLKGEGGLEDEQGGDTGWPIFLESLLLVFAPVCKK